MGRRLNIPNAILINVPQVKNILRGIPIVEGMGIDDINFKQIKNRNALAKFDSGPAIATNSIPSRLFFISLNIKGLTGTGLAHPK